MTVLLPIMIYFVLTLIGNLLKFISLLHIEDLDEEDGILSPKQISILFKVMCNMLAYFGVYSLTGDLDSHITQTDLDTNNFGPSMIALNLAFLIIIIKNYTKRKAIADAKGEDGKSSGVLGSTGLTTILTTLTQSTTTVCANGQCFTIFSNSISSNLAAFGVSVTGVNSYLMPLCCCLLTYSIWSQYKVKRELLYKPFLMTVVGAGLIIFDNFLYGEEL